MTHKKEMVGYQIYDRYKKVGYIGIGLFRADPHKWATKYDPQLYTWAERWL